MDKLIDIESFTLYKEASKLLKQNNIYLNKDCLISDPELCLDIINILEYFKE